MRIYLDNCCFNRPFDDQIQMKVRLETEAKLFIQDQVLKGKHELVWSYILEYENFQNTFEDRKDTIIRWKEVAVVDLDEDADIIDKAKSIQRLGIKSKDSLHIACAIYSESNFFITTDAKLLNKEIDGIKILNPIDFVREFEVETDEN